MRVDLERCRLGLRRYSLRPAWFLRVVLPLACRGLEWQILARINVSWDERLHEFRHTLPRFNWLFSDGLGAMLPTLSALWYWPTSRTVDRKKIRTWRMGGLVGTWGWGNGTSSISNYAPTEVFRYEVVERGRWGGCAQISRSIPGPMHVPVPCTP